MPSDASACHDGRDAEEPNGLNPVARLAARLRGLLADRSDTATAKKVAGGAFLFRVGNAGIAFASQILLARWMGESEYGIYVYVWTWVLLLGGMTSLGLASAPQKFIPEYADGGDHALLRGFLLGSRLLSMVFATVVTAVGLLALWLFGDVLDHWAIVPLVLALVCVPMYVLTDVQDGIARTYNWIDVALAPAYLVRPLLILALLAALSWAAYAPTAVTAMAATIVATWVTAIAQLALLEKRLRARTPRGPRAFAPRTWMAVSLPIFMVEGFYLLLAYTDVLVLSAFREPHEVGVYYAAVKVMSLVAFVSFSVSAAVAHRFTEYAVAGERERLETMVRDAARWTFWPSLGGAVIILALGWPILWLFGPAFVEGYPVLFVIAIGLLARATVGPLERLLNMLGQQNVCAAVYGGAFLLNIALAIALVPGFGMMGAAAATSLTLVMESILLFVITRRRLGLGALPWGRGPGGRPVVSRVAESVATGATDMGAVGPAPSLDLGVAAGARFEILDVAAMTRVRAAWADLAARAAEPTPFAAPDFAIPAAAHLATARRVRFAVVWDAAGAMLAALPITPRRLLPWTGGASTTLWAYLGPLGTPLLDAARAPEAIAALLDGLARSGRATLLFRLLPEHGPAAAALRTALAATGRASERIDGYGRALLVTGADPEAFLTASLSSKKLKELRRQLRRLGDEAPISFSEARAAHETPGALDRFLALEASGWKGKGGTSMRDNADQLAFIRETIENLAANGDVRFLEMTAGDAVVASALVLVNGRRAWYYKTAYDERFAKNSPGVHLTLELTRRLLEDPEIDSVDSTAIANHPMIDHIWRDKLALVDLMVSSRPGAARTLALSAAAERLRRRARVQLRDLYLRAKGLVR